MVPVALPINDFGQLSCIGKSEKGRPFRPLYNSIFRPQNIYVLLLVSVLLNQVHNLWAFSVIHAADIFANVVTRYYRIILCTAYIHCVGMQTRMRW